MPIAIDPLDNQSISEGDSLQLNGPDNIVNFHAQGTFDRHIAGIDWGDGTFSGPPLVQVSRAQVDPSGTTVPNDGQVFLPDHIYADAGTYTAIVSITDRDGTSADQVVAASFLVTVSEATPAIDDNPRQDDLRSAPR